MYELKFGKFENWYKDFFRIYLVASDEKFKVVKIYVISKLLKWNFFSDELVTNLETHLYYNIKIHGVKIWG